MAKYSHENEARANRGQPGSHSHNTPSKREEDEPPSFQIAPESAVFLATQHRYQITFRHINCADYNDRGIPDPADCSSSMFIDIMSPEGPNESPQWMQVCPGGCNEESGNGGDVFDAGDSMVELPLRDEAIAEILYKTTRALCDVMHPNRAQVVEIVDKSVMWSRDSPIPAYFSLSRGAIVAHSSAVTPGHLALMQVRGHVDNIQLDFRTYDPSIEY
ncbi:hypothetical protein F5X98DRAFT_370626 [Xylaria grammica]|nr:hypothetical protein F5X98DRAFT_370626 [Xylaria grammica]